MKETLDWIPTGSRRVPDRCPISKKAVPKVVSDFGPKFAEFERVEGPEGFDGFGGVCGDSGDTEMIFLWV